MALVTSRQMLRAAQSGSYAVGAFNAENMEMIKAIIRSAEQMRAPVIIQTTPSTAQYGTPGTFAAMARAEAAQADVPVCLHLDHGDSFALAVQAIMAGYTSVMIDGSQQEFEGNISLTCTVAQMAHAAGIPVEAELGTVGGKEDGLEAKGDAYTDPAAAREFVLRTGVDSLAVAIGTAHGFYARTPILDKERLSAIQSVVEVPLVLHGASGLGDGDIAQCIGRGICKVNFATELRAAYTGAIRSLLGGDANVIDPKALGKAGMAAVTQLVMNRMAVCGCEGKAQ